MQRRGGGRRCYGRPCEALAASADPAEHAADRARRGDRRDIDRACDLRPLGCAAALGHDGRGHMRALRIGTAIALLGAAVLIACLALDVIHWRDAIRRGDREFERSAAGAAWKASTVLPSDPARGLLGLGLPLRFRTAAQ